MVVGVAAEVEKVVEAGEVAARRVELVSANQMASALTAMASEA